MNNTFNYKTHRTGLLYVIIFTLFFCYLIPSLGFIIGIKVSKLHFPISILCSLILSFFLIKNLKVFIISFGIFCVLLLTSYQLSLLFYDFSWDGITYHQDAIVKLANGWNPVKENSNSPNGIWIDYYQKGIEIIQSTVYACTNKIEAPKLINFLFIFTAFLLVYDGVQSFIKSTLSKLVFTFVTVFSPIVIGQMFTYYIDGLYYLLLISTISCIISLYKKNNFKYYILFITLSTLLCGIKFSTLPTYIILVTGFLTYILIKKKYKILRPIITSGIIIVILTGITNINPLYTNYKENKHIFHPILGEEKVDVITFLIPSIIKDKNRFVQMYYSLSSESRNNFEDTPEEPYNFRQKIPFTISTMETQRLFWFDIRFGGFGFLFSGILSISLLIFILYPLFIYKKSQKQKEFIFGIYFILALTLLSIIINPVMWWARFVPQVWLIPILGLLLIWQEKNLITNHLKYSIIILLLYNTFLQTENLLKYNWISTQEIRKQIVELKKENKTYKIEVGPFTNIHLRLKENGIKYKEDTINSNFIYMAETWGVVKLKAEE